MGPRSGYRGSVKEQGIGLGQGSGYRDGSGFVEHGLGPGSRYRGWVQVQGKISESG